MPDPTRSSPSGPLRIIERIISVDPPNALAITTTPLVAALAFPEAEVDDYVKVTPLSALTAGNFVAYALVSALGAVQVYFGNHTAAPINDVAQNMLVSLYKNPSTP